MNVVVTGSIGLDYIMNFPGRFADRIMPDNIHKISLAPIVETFTKQFGGTATNTAYSLKLLGVQPFVVASAGNDFGDYKKFLTKHKVSTKYIFEAKDFPTGSYFVVTDQEDNQIGAFSIGAMKYDDTLSVATVKEAIQFVHIGPTKPTAMVKNVKECQKLKLPYLYDPAFQIAEFTPEQLKEGISGASMLIGNDYEIDLIKQKIDGKLEDLLAMVPVVIVTIGSKGSIIETRKESIHIRPAKPKNTSDPTGAGDAYRAGFIAGHVRGYDLVTCGKMGSVAAVYTVEKYGTVTHFFTKKEFIKRYEENYGETILL
jgi:adenosine kinase